MSFERALTVTNLRARYAYAEQSVVGEVNAHELTFQGMPVVVAADGTLRVTPYRDVVTFPRLHDAARGRSHRSTLAYLKALWRYGSVYGCLYNRHIPPEMTLPVLTVAFRVPEGAWLAMNGG